VRRLRYRHEARLFVQDLGYRCGSRSQLGQSLHGIREWNHVEWSQTAHGESELGQVRKISGETARLTRDVENQRGSQRTERIAHHGRKAAAGRVYDYRVRSRDAAERLLRGKRQHRQLQSLLLRRVSEAAQSRSKAVDGGDLGTASRQAQRQRSTPCVEIDDPFAAKLPEGVP
jgi:hypothetical protein